MISSGARWSPLMWTADEGSTPSPNPRRIAALPGPGAHNVQEHSLRPRAGGKIGTGRRDNAKDPSYYMPVRSGPGPKYDAMTGLRVSKKHAPTPVMGAKVKFGSVMEAQARSQSPGPVYLPYSSRIVGKQASPQFSFASPLSSPPRSSRSPKGKRARRARGSSPGEASFRSSGPPPSWGSLEAGPSNYSNLQAGGELLADDPSVFSDAGLASFYRGEVKSRVWGTAETRAMRAGMWSSMRSMDRGGADTNVSATKGHELSQSQRHPRREGWEAANGRDMRP